MKRTLFLLLILGIGAFAFFGRDVFRSKPKKAPSYPVTEEKSFAIIIPSYNNERYIERNLRSIFSQNYDNYRVIYIDDNSRDATLEKAQSLLAELDPKGRSTLIHNPVNLGALANIYNAVHSCHDHEIIFLVDGDDHLAHDNVLNTLNKAYANPGIWMTYGNYLDYPSYEENPHITKPYKDRVVEKGTFRSVPWSAIPPRTFYASLFKEIKLSDLFYRGSFYTMASDVAFMIPLMEMAAPHIGYIDETLYLYNRENPINDHKLNVAFQSACHGHIAARPPYPRLAHLPSHIPSKDPADLLILSQDNPMGAATLLESVAQYVTGLGKITLLYSASTPEIDSLYLELKLEHPSHHFIKQDTSLKPLLLSTLLSPTQENAYVLLAKDTQILKDLLDVTEATRVLRATNAHSLHLSHHSRLTYSTELDRHLPLPPMVALGGIGAKEAPLAWQFSAGTDDWNTPSLFSFTLMGKQTLRTALAAMEFSSLETLEVEWNQVLPQEEVGLFYTSAKSAELRPYPFLSTEELCEKFEQGMQVNVAPYFQLESCAKEISANVEFIPR
jgi:glycosyltransferase involved in cell wall biosynthesis